MKKSIPVWIVLSLYSLISFSQERVTQESIILDGYIYEVVTKNKKRPSISFVSHERIEKPKIGIRKKGVYVNEPSIKLVIFSSVQPKIIYDSLGFFVSNTEWNSSFPSRDEIVKNRPFDGISRIYIGKAKAEIIQYQKLENLTGKKFEDMDWVIFGDLAYPDDIINSDQYYVVLRFFPVD